MDDPRPLCNFHSSIQYTKSKYPQKYLTFCLFPSLFLPESQDRRMFLARIVDCSEITVLARIAECLELKIVSAVTWISLSIKFVVFASTMKKKHARNLTVASHRHPTELACNYHGFQQSRHNAYHCSLILIT